VNIVGTNPKEATFEFKILLSIGASELHIIKNYEKQVIVQQFRSMVDTAFQDESVEALGSIIEIINRYFPSKRVLIVVVRVQMKVSRISSSMRRNIEMR
jgi:uncharacterized protein YybS (DUF2232 family)